MASADSPTRECGEVGCDRPHRARGLCSTHYNQRQSNRHRKVSVACGWCGRQCEKAEARSMGYSERFCSDLCRGAMYAYRLVGPLSCPLTRWHPAHLDYTPPLPVLWQPPARRPRAPRVFVAGTCRRCGCGFVAEDYTDTAMYCSRSCSRRTDHERRRARKKLAYVADVWRSKIFERDGWRCQICKRKVKRTAVVPEPLAPTVDHIVPLAKGGTHEPANVQCAHYICNSIKRDQLDDAVQLALFG